MFKICVFNRKGGAGKTSSTCNIASFLEKDFGKKVLIVDCDSQKNSTDYILTDAESETKYDIVDVIKNRKRLKDIIIQAEFNLRRPVRPQIYVVPSSIDIEKTEVEDVLFFKDQLSEIENEFDICLFDCPPQLSELSYSALACADYVLVPSKADTDSLGGYGQLIDTINEIRNSGINIDLKIMGIFFNEVDSQRALENFLINDCRENMGDMIFSTTIRSAAIVDQARYYGHPVAYFRPGSNVGKDYRRLCGEILERLGR